MKFKLKLSRYLAKSKRSVIQLYIHISENYALRVRRHLFGEFLFVYLSVLPKNDVVMTLLQYILFGALLIPFNSVFLL